MIYINGVRASTRDLHLLYERVRAGKEVVVNVHRTSKGGLAYVTA